MTKKLLSHLKKYLDAYVIGLIGLFISLGLFYALQIQEEGHILSIAQLGIETINNNIRSELSFDAHVLQHMANLKATRKAQIEELLQAYPRFYAAAEINSAQGVDWYASPKTSPINESFLLSFYQKSAYKMNSSRSFWISPPLKLPDQQLAFLMVYPTKTSTIIALIDCNSLFYHSAHIPGMIFDIYLNQQIITPTISQDGRQPWLFEISQFWYGALWEIKAREETVQVGVLHFISHEAPLSWLTLLLGIFISILLARSIALSGLLKERSISLNKTNQDLKNEITEHIQTEKSKKNLEKALLQGQKLQAIGTLAGGIAHDFNNILYAIRGYVELARDDLPKDGLIYKNLGKVLEGTYRGQDLVSRILSFSRRQHHELSPLHLKTEITGALALLRPTVPETVELQFKSSIEGKILGNKTQIHQVIVNLINNAVDSMDENEGTITINLSEVLAKDMLRPENYCKIEISDTGHGMEQSTVERIFEPFFTTKEVGKGTGLGLSTVHAIIKEHNGEIMVNSQLGKGTTFTLFFPEHSNSHEEAQHG